MESDWQEQARLRLKSADAALRNETIVRAVGLISEARLVLPDRQSRPGHLLRASAAVLMADAWSAAGDLDAARKEIKRARSHTYAATTEPSAQTPSSSTPGLPSRIIARVDRHPEADLLSRKADLAMAYVDECDGKPRLSLTRARGIARLHRQEPEIEITAIARWIAGAIKTGSAPDAVAAERHLQERFGESRPSTRVTAEARALLLRWMAVFRVVLGHLDDAEDLLDTNADHYVGCRRCALLDQLVNCHIAAARGGEGNRKLARELLATVRQEAEHERGILSPILFFEQHVLGSLDLD